MSLPFWGVIGDMMGTSCLRWTLYRCTSLTDEGPEELENMLSSGVLVPASKSIFIVGGLGSWVILDGYSFVGIVVLI